MKHPTLLPMPRQLDITEGVCAVASAGFIALNSAAAGDLLFAARQLQAALGSGWEIVAGSGFTPAASTISLNVIPNSLAHAEGYEVTVDCRSGGSAEISIVATSAAGIFYGVQTVRQLLAQYGSSMPAMRLRDWPDFPNRGVMIDVSRDKVPTMETLYAQIDMLAGWKYNQIQLYTEHTFAYRQHPKVWAEASPITAEEVLLIDAYCRERFIELVPNQNTFGHMRPWLIHDEYKHLAEAPDGCNTIWGWFDEPFTLYPAEPGSLALVQSMLDELLPCFSSQQVNVGLDETIDLGEGRSKELVAEKGAGRVYLDFLLKIYQDVKRRGKTMQLWGDILMNHPELVPELPRDVVAMEWGYEAEHDFDGHSAIFAKSGIPFYVCPGTSSWRTLAGRTDNALENLRSAAESGLKHGAIGYLVTDWGDEGHWQPQSASYVPLAYGAGLAWAFEQNVDADAATIASAFAFGDSAETMGKLAYDLGNVYQTTGIPQYNSTILFNALQATPEVIQTHLSKEDDTVEARIEATQTAIDEILGRLESAEMTVPDAPLILDEFAWAGHMLRHACKRILWVKNGMDSAEAAQLATAARQLISDHHKMWHARNRPGGYQLSVARLEKMLATYEAA